MCRWQDLVGTVSHKSCVWLTSRLPLYLWFQVEDRVTNIEEQCWLAGRPRGEQSRAHRLLPWGAPQDECHGEQHVPPSWLLPGISVILELHPLISSRSPSSARWWGARNQSWSWWRSTTTSPRYLTSSLNLIWPLSSRPSKATTQPRSSWPGPPGTWISSETIVTPQEPKQGRQGHGQEAPGLDLWHGCHPYLAAHAQVYVWRESSAQEEVRR